MCLCRVQLCCNYIFYSPSIQILHILVTGSDHFKNHDFPSIQPSPFKEFQIQSLHSCLCSNSLSKCWRLQISVFVSEMFTTLYMERTSPTGKRQLLSRLRKFYFLSFLNPQQNLPKFFCSESWKLSIVENLRKMLRYAQNINYSSWFHKVNFKIFNLGLPKWISSYSWFYLFC